MKITVRKEMELNGKCDVTLVFTWGPGRGHGASGERSTLLRSVVRQLVHFDQERFQSRAVHLQLFVQAICLLQQVVDRTDSLKQTPQFTG